MSLKRQFGFVLLLVNFMLLHRTFSTTVQAKVDRATTTHVNTDIYKAVNSFMELHSVPGLSLAIQDDISGNTVAMGYGLRDIEKQLPADNATYFAIASITKVFRYSYDMKLTSSN
jgi:CubicO group peptidase (beta-lactamase class C family)